MKRKILLFLTMGIFSATGAEKSWEITPPIDQSHRLSPADIAASSFQATPERYRENRFASSSLISDRRLISADQIRKREAQRAQFIKKEEERLAQTGRSAVLGHERFISQDETK
jgi:hypothetical protein